MDLAPWAVAAVALAHLPLKRQNTCYPLVEAGELVHGPVAEAALGLRVHGCR